MQTTIKRIILVLLTILLCDSGTMVTYAQTSNEALHNAKQALEQSEKIVEQKAQEKQSVNQEIEKIQQELESLYTYITKNKEAMAQTQLRIDATNRLIDQKKGEIIILEDKILSRKDVMKKRAVALQQNDNVNVMISVFLESKSLNDFIQRASAVTALISADKDILAAQKADLQQIEEDKKEIDRQEQKLEDDQKALAAQQVELDQNMQKRQQNLTLMQEKYNQIVQQMALAETEKAGIESQMKDIQAKISEEQAAAKTRAASPTSTASSNTSSNTSNVAVKGKEMYVSATAYSPESSGSITAMGYNIKANPNMKLIAVDPSVIPLGSKVWVEGYGVAVAGDTGGAIKGHIIDVLMPTTAAARSWGRKNVKIIILE